MLDAKRKATTRTVETEAQTEELIEGGTKRIAQVVCTMLSQGVPMEQIEQRTGLSYGVLKAAVHEVNPGAWNTYFWQREKAIMERVSELAAAKEEGIAEGRAEIKKYVARNMLSDNVPIQQIQKCTGLSVSEIEALQK